MTPQLLSGKFSRSKKSTNSIWSATRNLKPRSTKAVNKPKKGMLQATLFRVRRRSLAGVGVGVGVEGDVAAIEPKGISRLEVPQISQRELPPRPSKPPPANPTRIHVADVVANAATTNAVRLPIAKNAPPRSRSKWTISRKKSTCRAAITLPIPTSPTGTSPPGKT